MNIRETHPDPIREPVFDRGVGHVQIAGIEDHPGRITVLKSDELPFGEHGIFSVARSGLSHSSRYVALLIALPRRVGVSERDAASDAKGLQTHTS